MVAMNAVRKWLVVGVLTAAAVGAAPFFPYRGVLQPQTPTEIAKLFQVLHVYQNKNYELIYNGNTYQIKNAFQKARLFIVSHYRGERADVWVRKHLYRTPDQGKIIYLASPDGSRRPLRDVLIAELNHHFSS